MKMTQRWLLIVTLIACCLKAQGANKWYNDEDSKRPYEFGFTIDGEQHRQEKKDENGLIMGEFGFLTADGVYHVTVYATDEDGNFKVLSMKNIRVKPYPTAATTAAPVKESKAIPFPPSSPSGLKPPPPASPARSCSSCSIPTSTPAPQLTNIADVATDQQYPNYNSPAENYPQQPQQPSPELSPPQDYPQQPDEQPGVPGPRNPKQYEPQDGAPGQPPSKPVLIAAQMQIVDKNTDIYARGPGEREGLPEGLDKKDMMLLLYTFNYTVGFHGHHEEGYTNGAKKGYYYVTGRNGVRTRVDYEADEKGFRPKITQEVLDLVSEDVPKEETEKDAKYGLKGYEFKWLYYPVDSKRR